MKKKILIVDDNELNRDILREILSDQYDAVEACDGLEAVKQVNSFSDCFAAILLDIMMPNMDGYETLAYFKNHDLIADCPVIMISAETNNEALRKAYVLGATDYIMRPFDSVIVQQRVSNSIKLYEKQHRLQSAVIKEMIESNKSSRLMINILSHIVEFRNGESGLHVMNVQHITKILLEELNKSFPDKYNFSYKEIENISLASALHDIGKISIDSNILNKPGRLSDDEYQIMKTHSYIGYEILNNLPIYQDDILVKYAKEITRHHHERKDGKGYPDGLKDDDNNIISQAVALADVYDALSSDRVYKKAFSHEETYDIIVNKETDHFVDDIITVFKKCHLDIKRAKLYNYSFDDDNDVIDSIKGRFNEDLLEVDDNVFIKQLEQASNRANFILNNTSDYIVEWSKRTGILTLSGSLANKYNLKTFYLLEKEADDIQKIVDKQFYSEMHNLDRVNGKISIPCIIQGDRYEFSAFVSNNDDGISVIGKLGAI